MLEIKPNFFKAKRLKNGELIKFIGIKGDKGDKGEDGKDAQPYDDTEVRKDIDLLYKLTQGQSWDFVDQTEHGMSVAPKGTKVQSLLSVEGKSEQKTTNGYNKIKLVDGSYSSGTTIATVKDNIITITGTTGQAKGINIPLETPFTLTGDMTFSCGEKLKMAYYLGTRENSAEVLLMPSGVTSTTVKVTSTAVITQIRIYLLADSTDGKTYYMLEEGDTAHEYEPYTGGIPSPNPYYPQEITSVEELNFEVAGKNLFSPSYMSTSFTDESDTWTSAYSFFGKARFPVNPNTTYIFSVNGVGASIRHLFYDEDGNEITSPTTKITFTTPPDARFIKFRTIESVTATDVAMLEYGNTVTSYSPYKEIERHTITPPFKLNKIGEISDLAEVSSGLWFRNIEEYTFTGNENWITAGDGAKYVAYADDLTGFKFGRGNDIIVYSMSNRYTSATFKDVRTLKNEALSVQLQSAYSRFWASPATDTSKMAGTKINLVRQVPTETPIDTADLDFLKSLQNMDESNVITITDQNGNDITYLMKYLIKLSEAI